MRSIFIKLTSSSRIRFNLPCFNIHVYIVSYKSVSFIIYLLLHFVWNIPNLFSLNRYINYFIYIYIHIFIKKKILLGSDRDLFSCKRISSFLYWKGYIIFKAIIYFHDMLFLHAFQWHTSTRKRIFMKTSIIFFHYTSVIFQYFDFHVFKFRLSWNPLLYYIIYLLQYFSRGNNMIWCDRFGTLKLSEYLHICLHFIRFIFIWNQSCDVKPTSLIFETMIYFYHVVFSLSSLPPLSLFFSVSVIIERQRMIFRVPLQDSMARTSSS